MDDIDPQLRQAIEERSPEERKRIEERRQRVREEYLPKRRQAAKDLLARAQAEVAKLRAINPQLDEREESLKREKGELEAQIAELNEDIRRKSRGLGLVRHFMSITQADRERQRILGKLEATNNTLYSTRREWEQQREQVEEEQANLQERWQLESIAVARLRSELDQLDNPQHRDTLALRRAIRYVLDALEDSTTSSSADLAARLEEMVKLNLETDAYHEGLASVGGVIGLLGGIDSGLKAIRKSIEGLEQEQQMHSAYLKPLNFSLPPRVQTFHRLWSGLTEQFKDEAAIATHPTAFSAAVAPLIEGPLSQANIEAMFNDLGTMIEHSTAAW
jgi:chromosome segregation ATPase